MLHRRVTAAWRPSVRCYHRSREFHSNFLGLLSADFHARYHRNRHRRGYVCVVSPIRGYVERRVGEVGAGRDRRARDGPQSYSLAPFYYGNYYFLCTVECNFRNNAHRDGARRRRSKDRRRGTGRFRSGDHVQGFLSRGVAYACSVHRLIRNQSNVGPRLFEYRIRCTYAMRNQVSGRQRDTRGGSYQGNRHYFVQLTFRSQLNSRCNDDPASHTANKYRRDRVFVRFRRAPSRWACRCNGHRCGHVSRSNQGPSLSRTLGYRPRAVRRGANARCLLHAGRGAKRPYLERVVTRAIHVCRSRRGASSREAGK